MTCPQGLRIVILRGVIGLGSVAFALLQPLGFAQERAMPGLDGRPDKPQPSKLETGPLRAGESKDDAERRAQIEEFHNARMAMLEEMAQVRAKVGGDAKMQRQAVDLWQNENGARIQAIQQQALAIANSQPVAKPQPIPPVELPRNASEELKAFLLERTRLYNEEIAVNERSEQSPGQSDAILKDWQKRKDARLASQMKLAQALADKSGMEPLLPPPQIEIPPGVSREIRELLIERNTLLNERADAQAKQPLREGQTQADWLMKWYNAKPERFRNLQQKAQQAAE